MADDPTRVDETTTAAHPTIADEATIRLADGRHPKDDPHARSYRQEGSQYHAPTNVTGRFVFQGNFMNISESNKLLPHSSTLLLTDCYQIDVDDPDNQRLLEWLSPLTFEDKQVDVYGVCQPEYWTWLFDDVKFKAWCQGRKSHFLLCPGMGRSYMSMSVEDPTDLCT